MSKLPNHLFHLVFSIIMSGIMVTAMTFVITWANVGLNPNFLLQWLHAAGVAFPVAMPLVYLVAPIARKWTAKLVEA